ncbi:MAG: 3'-5' exonuclease [Vampirovibrionales bacterium]
MQQSLFAAFDSSGLSSDNNSTFTPPPPPMSADTPLEEVVYTVLDLETTGLHPKKNAITELVAIQYQHQQERGRVATLVKPTESIPEQVVAITGITDAMVAQAPAPIVVLRDACQLLGPSPVIVGHNVAFDIGFLQAKLQDNGLNGFLARVDLAQALCTRALAKKIIPGLPSYEGVAVANACGIYNANPHRAEYDVKMTADMLWVLLKRLREQDPSIHTLGHLLAFQGPLG